MRNFSIVLAVSSVLLSLQTAFATAPTDLGDDGETTILFTGDILLDRGVRRVVERHGFHALFADDSLRTAFKNAHFIVGNLECPATRIESPAFKRFVFRSEPQWLDSLHAYGFTHLNLANNHSVDQGRQGLRDTRQNILRAGMTPVGADSTMLAAARPHRLDGNIFLLASNRLPLESYAYLPDRESVSQEPLDALLQRIKTLKNTDSTAVVVVMLHWGAEHRPHPLPQQRVEAHAMIDAGADVIIGHHPHTLQSTETYKGKSIFYSIGNFIFDQQKPLNTRACVVRLRVTKEKTVAEAIPIQIECCAPRIEPKK